MSKDPPPATGSQVRTARNSTPDSPADGGAATAGRPGPNRARIALLLAGALGGIAAIVWYQTRVALPEEIPPADYELAQQQFRLRYGRSPGRVDVFSLLGEQYVAAGRLQQAAVCFAQIPGSHPRYGAPARLQAGQVLMRLNRAADAEQEFREFLELARQHDGPPGHQRTAYQWLVYLLSVEQRLEDRKRVLAAMHEQNLAGVWESKLYFFPYQLVWNSMDGHERLRTFLEQDAENPLLRLARARYLIAAGELESVAPVLAELHAADPGDLGVLAAVLEYHFERADWERFERAAAVVPSYADGEPWQLTRLRGELALHQKHWEEAITQFERVLDADPANPWSHMGLATACGRLGREEQRDEMLRRSRILADIRVNMYNVSESDPGGCRDLADKCEQLNMPEAAHTFRQHAVRIERRGGRGDASDASRPPAATTDPSGGEPR